jgi:hypothetical protein
MPAPAVVRQRTPTAKSLGMVADCPCPACLQDQPGADAAPDNDLLLLKLPVQQLLLVLIGLTVAVWRLMRSRRRSTASRQ